MLFAKASHHAEFRNEMADTSVASVYVPTRWTNNQKRLAHVSNAQIPTFLEVLDVSDFAVFLLDEKALGRVFIEVHVVDSVCLVVVLCHHNLSDEFTADSLLEYKNMSIQCYLKSIQWKYSTSKLSLCSL